MQIDLTEAEAALAEEAGSPHGVRLLGHDFTIPATIPPLFAVLWVSGEQLKALRALLGDDQFDVLTGLRPTNAHLILLKDAAFQIYGSGDEGKSSGPAEPSTATSPPSKQTSAATTS